MVSVAVLVTVLGASVTVVSSVYTELIVCVATLVYVVASVMTELTVSVLVMYSWNSDQRVHEVVR